MSLLYRTHVLRGDKRPPMLSVVCCLLSVVCCLLSVVCCLLSVVRCPSSFPYPFTTLVPSAKAFSKFPVVLKMSALAEMLSM